MADYGNRTTDNALIADSGEDLIAKALLDIEQETDWQIADREKFAGAKGTYYDSAKLGSYFVEVKNSNGVQGVLKIQLRPLSFDEGFIIRHITPQIRTDKIRLPKLFADKPWNKEGGYGYLIFEDLSHFPKIWSSLPPVADNDYRHHKEFLKEFLNNLLPIEPFVEKPKTTPLEQARESFDHYLNIAKNSSHQHIAPETVEHYKQKYFEVLKKANFEDIHFTHGHLTGLDIAYDESNRQYVVMGNLYWKWRPKYWELTFPVWNSIMHVRDKNFTFEDFMSMLNRWNTLWSTELYDHNPVENQQYWINLLAMSMNTIMLDLGASEWKENEVTEKQVLLQRWEEFFDWLIENKFRN